MCHILYFPIKTIIIDTIITEFILGKGWASTLLQKGLSDKRTFLGLSPSFSFSYFIQSRLVRSRVILLHSHVMSRHITTIFLLSRDPTWLGNFSIQLHLCIDFLTTPYNTAV